MDIELEIVAQGRLDAPPLLVVALVRVAVR
jgi:hypothetical protein